MLLEMMSGLSPWSPCGLSSRRALINISIVFKSPDIAQLSSYVPYL